MLRVGHPSGHLLRRCYRFHHLPTPIRRILKNKLGKSAFECSKHCFANSNMMRKIGVVSCQQTSLETSCNMLSWMHMNSVWLKVIDLYGASLQTCSLKLVPRIEMDSLRCYLNSKSCAPFKTEKKSLNPIPLYGLEGLPQGDDKQYQISSWSSSPRGINGFLFFVHFEVTKNIQKLSHCIHILASPKWRHRRSDIAGKSMETGHLKFDGSFLFNHDHFSNHYCICLNSIVFEHSGHVNLGTVLQMLEPATSMTWCVSGHPKRSRTPHILLLRAVVRLWDALPSFSDIIVISIRNGSPWTKHDFCWLYSISVKA